MNGKLAVCIIAGLLAPVLWTALESVLIPLMPVASSQMMRRAVQVFVALISAGVLVLPLVWFLRPVSVWLGLWFVASFVGSETAYQFYSGGTGQDVWALFELLDTWVFLGASLALFLWGSTRKSVRRGA